MSEIVRGFVILIISFVISILLTAGALFLISVGVHPVLVLGSLTLLLVGGYIAAAYSNN